MVQIHVRVGVLGPPVGFDPSGPSDGDTGPKAMVPTMPPFFRLGSSVFPDWKNTLFFTCFSLITGGI